MSCQSRFVVRHLQLHRRNLVVDQSADRVVDQSADRVVDQAVDRHTVLRKRCSRMGGLAVAAADLVESVYFAAMAVGHDDLARRRAV